MAGSLQQQLDEVRGFLPRLVTALSESEYFLELIDQQKKVGTLFDIGLSIGFDKSEAATTECGPGLQYILLINFAKQI